MYCRALFDEVVGQRMMCLRCNEIETIIARLPSMLCSIRVFTGILDTWRRWGGGQSTYICDPTSHLQKKEAVIDEENERCSSFPTCWVRSRSWQCFKHRADITRTEQRTTRKATTNRMPTGPSFILFYFPYPPPLPPADLHGKT